MIELLGAAALTLNSLPEINGSTKLAISQKQRKRIAIQLISNAKVMVILQNCSPIHSHFIPIAKYSALYTFVIQHSIFFI